MAEHLMSWLPLRVANEYVEGSRAYVWVEMARPVAHDSARDFARECPGYVAKSFKALR